MRCLGKPCQGLGEALVLQFCDVEYSAETRFVVIRSFHSFIFRSDEAIEGDVVAHPGLFRPWLNVQADETEVHRTRSFTQPQPKIVGTVASPFAREQSKNEPVKLREWDLDEAAENPLKLPSHLSAGLWVAMHDYSRLLLYPYRAASH